MSSNDKYILAIDLGTSGPKVALFSAQGEMLGSEFEEVRLLLFENGGAEQSPDEWWEAIDKAAQRLLARGLAPSEDIVAVSSTGQWSGTVAVDADGNSLGNAVIWMDSRGAPYIRKIAGGPLSGYAPDKLLKWIQRTAGAPAISGKDPIAHILFLKHVRPEIYQRTHKFLEPIDYIGFRLTGRMAASFDSITLHWLTDNRDISNVKYDDGLIRLTGLDRSKLPDLQSANSILGPLHADVARAWGLRADVNVVVGSPDIHSASIGSGAVRDFESHVYIGTSSWLTCHVPFKKTDIFHGLASLPSAIPGRYLQTNAQECAGVCLTFLRDNVFFHNGLLGNSAKPENAYRLFDEVVANTPAGSGRVLFLPWLYGERAPIDDRYVRGGFFNLSLSSTREEMVRAVFEGVAFNSRWLLKYVEIFNGRRAEAVNMVGGGAKSDVWCQIMADVMDRPIRQMKDPIEVNVRGAALLASAALGFIQYEEIGAHVPVAKTYQPNPENRKLYDELFKEFVAIYESNKKIFARLNRVA
ncbi:MAG: xylulokinase [Chloroflexota bacterium]